jgi:Skp family chaperone for outer membrane proteins
VLIVAAAILAEVVPSPSSGGNSNSTTILIALSGVAAALIGGLATWLTARENRRRYVAQDEAQRALREKQNGFSNVSDNLLRQWARVQDENETLKREVAELRGALDEQRRVFVEQEATWQTKLAKCEARIEELESAKDTEGGSSGSGSEPSPPS